MKEKINPVMLTLARESRQMFQQELSERLEVSKTYMCFLEQEPNTVNPDLLKQLSKVLNYPKSFFFQEGEIVPPNLSYRKRDKVSIKDINSIEAFINIYRNNIQRLYSLLDFPVLKLPKISENPNEAATQIRHKWKLPKGVIENMTTILEENNITVINFDFGTERVDARSVFTNKKHPIIFINSRMTGDRQRFTLAYELGHLLLHLNGQDTFNKDVSHEANLFAAELLMPENDIIPDFEEMINLNVLAKLKKKWKVSMISLFHRAEDLGALTPNQSHYLLKQFNQQGIRRREPLELDIPHEQNTLLKSVISQYKQKKRLTYKELAEDFHLTENEFSKMYN